MEAKMQMFANSACHQGQIGDSGSKSNGANLLQKLHPETPLENFYVFCGKSSAGNNN